MACRCCGARDGDAVDVLVAACDVLILRALETAGRLIYGRSRRADHRGALEDVPPHLVHTVRRPTPDEVERILAQSWGQLATVHDWYGCCGWTMTDLRDVLGDHLRRCLEQGRAHEHDDLAQAMGLTTTASA